MIDHEEPALAYRLQFPTRVESAAGARSHAGAWYWGIRPFLQHLRDSQEAPSMPLGAAYNELSRQLMRYHRTTSHLDRVIVSIV